MRDLCRSCETALPWLIPAALCQICGLQLREIKAGVCGGCLRKPPAISRCVSLWDYRKDSACLVQKLKFGQNLLYARMLGELLADRITAVYQAEPLPELILPVPLHPRRLCTRGFNQSVELGRFLQKTLGLPMSRDIVKRTRHSPPQTELAATERRKNLRGAFTVTLPCPYQHVAILDDVITTLSTCQELAKTLRRAGVVRVDVWNCIRTQGDYRS